MGYHGTHLTATHLNNPIRNTMRNEKSTYSMAVGTHGARCTCDKLSENSGKLFENICAYDCGYDLFVFCINSVGVY